MPQPHGLLGHAFVVAVGVAAIALLAEWVLRRAIRLAAHFGLSGGFLGLSILSVGTSIPEVVTHLVGSFRIVQDPDRMEGLSALLLGTNVGSDIFQQDFVLPVVALVGVARVVRSEMVRQCGALVAASLLLWVVAASGFVSRIEGAVLVLAYLGYLAFLARGEADTGEIEDARGFERRRGVALAALGIVAGFAAMSWTAEAVLSSAEALVERLPVSASFFGVIVLGVATALPELTTALLSVRKGREELSTAVLIGSNVTNPLFAIGAGALLSGYAVPGVVVVYDLPVKIATAVVLSVFLWRRSDLDRKEAVLLLAVYLAYAAARRAFFPEDVALAGGP